MKRLPLCRYGVIYRFGNTESLACSENMRLLSSTCCEANTLVLIYRSHSYRNIINALPASLFVCRMARICCTIWTVDKSDSKGYRHKVVCQSRLFEFISTGPLVFTQMISKGSKGVNVMHPPRSQHSSEDCQREVEGRG